MKLMINALSTTNLSGAHVILGHLRSWLRNGTSAEPVRILCHEGNREMFEALGEGVVCRIAPDVTRNWLGRARWEQGNLSQVIREVEVDVVLSLSGFCGPVRSTPCVPYAMNPWSLVPGMAQGGREQLKAFMQRRAYVGAVRNAEGIAVL